MPEKLEEVVDILKEQGFEPASWLDISDVRVMGLLVLILLGVAIYVLRVVRHVRRRRRKPTIHPLLQKYGQEHAAPSPAVVAQRRAEAEKIVATSSTPHIAGYEIVEQVEAIFVDGFARPEDALEGLKAVAAMKSANAVTNVRHDRSASGRCTASGDAVIVHRAGVSEVPADHVDETAARGGEQPD